MGAKLFEKLENRDRYACCVGLLVGLFYKWICVCIYIYRYMEEGNGVRRKVKRGGAGNVNVGKVRLTYFHRL